MRRRRPATPPGQLRPPCSSPAPPTTPRSCSCCVPPTGSCHPLLLSSATQHHAAAAASSGRNEHLPTFRTCSHCLALRLGANLIHFRRWQKVGEKVSASTVARRRPPPHHERRSGGLGGHENDFIPKLEHRQPPAAIGSASRHVPARCCAGRGGAGGWIALRGHVGQDKDLQSGPTLRKGRGVRASGGAQGYAGLRRATQGRAGPGRPAPASRAGPSRPSRR